MSMFIFKNSRRQLLDYLLSTVDELSGNKGTGPEGKEKDDEEKSRKKENLLKGAKAADRHIRGLEFWSDIKPMVTGHEQFLVSDPSRGRPIHQIPVENINIGAEIKGIPEEAGIGVDEGHIY
jgi:hypothetical protein